MVEHIQLGQPDNSNTLASQLSATLPLPSSAPGGGSTARADFLPSQILGDDDKSALGGAANASLGQGKSSKKGVKEDLASALKKNAKPEDAEKCQALILKINRYCNHERFKDYLSSLGIKPSMSELRRMELHELEDLLVRVRTSVCNRERGGIVGVGVRLGVQFAENVTQRPDIKPRLDLAGWSRSLETDEMFQDALAEMEIEHSVLTGLPPYQRLLLALSASAFRVSRENQFNAARLRFMEMMREGPPAPPQDNSAENAPKDSPAASEPAASPHSSPAKDSGNSGQPESNGESKSSLGGPFQPPPEQESKEETKAEQSPVVQPSPSANERKRRGRGRPRLHNYQQLLGLGGQASDVSD